MDTHNYTQPSGYLNKGTKTQHTAKCQKHGADMLRYYCHLDAMHTVTSIQAHDKI